MWVLETILKVLLLGLVPPGIWRLMRGARLSGKPNGQVDKPEVDREDFLWEACMTAVTLSVMGFVLMASGMLPFLGSGYAYAGDVDKKIEARALQTEKRIDKLDATVKTFSDLLLENLVEGTQSKIRTQLLKRCKTLGWAEREEINREIENLQKQHFKYSGQRYTEPTCAQL